MTREQIYEIWHPLDSPWSRWVKSVLFSYLGDKELKATRPSTRRWEVPHASDTAIVADLPGVAGVALGLTLCAEGGYRPVPIYNACPYAMCEPPSGEFPSIVRAEPRPAPAVVDLAPIMSALCWGAEDLAAAKLPPAAPPVFLIDENRRGTLPDPGWFDNRSFVSTADFPSAKLLRQQGVSRVVLMQTGPKIQADLLQVLFAWQQDGIAIARQKPWEPWIPQVFKVKQPSLIALLWHWLLKFGYRRNASGSFGDLVRPSSS